MMKRLRKGKLAAALALNLDEAELGTRSNSAGSRLQFIEAALRNIEKASYGSLFGEQFSALADAAAAATLIGTSWSWSLVRAAGGVLLDVSADPTLSSKIAARLEKRGDRISDLHLRRVGPGHIATIVSVVSDHPETSSAYKKRLSDLPGLSHLTIEVERCPGIHG